ncbi:3'-5' exonuclease [soil metagenome]
MKKIAPSKEETALLPPFAGLTIDRILVPATAAAFASARDEILAAALVGFDTESKPTFKVGDVSEGPHVVQFALPTKAYIFQLHQPAALDCLAPVLASERVLKVGFGLQSDHAQVHAKLGLRMQGVIDLNQNFRRMGYGSSMGVRAAVGVVLQQHFHKSKKITTTNWALPDLSDRQLLYAANDAYAALKVMEALAQQDLLGSDAHLA